MSYVLAGVFAAISGVLLAIRYNQGNMALAVQYDYDAIAAVLVGGTPIQGGDGSMIRTLVGVLAIRSSRLSSCCTASKKSGGTWSPACWYSSSSSCTRVGASDHHAFDRVQPGYPPLFVADDCYRTPCGGRFRAGRFLSWGRLTARSNGSRHLAW